MTDDNYPTHVKAMNVTQNGSPRWKSYYWVYMSRGLIGRQAAVEDVHNGPGRIFYRNVFLGFFNEHNIREKTPDGQADPPKRPSVGRAKIDKT